MMPSIFCAPTSVGLMRSPSFWARIKWIALISLPESKKTAMDFFQIVIGYRIHRTHARFGYSPLLSLPSLLTSVVSIALAVSTTSFLVPVTSMEVAETDTSFLILFLDFEDTCWRNAFSGDRYNTRLG